MDRASLFTDDRISGRPIRAKYKQIKTICEHTFDKSPTAPNSSLKWWSSMHGAEFGGHVGTEQETSEQSQREEARVDIEEMRGEMTKDGQMIQQEAPNEAELDWEVS